MKQKDKGTRMGKRKSKAQKKTADTQALLIGETVIGISSSQGTTQAYEEIISGASDGVECTISVEQDSIPHGYKTLEISQTRECVSIANEDGTISYRVLTHRFSGKAIEFGAAFTSKGEIELYSFASEGSLGADCKLIGKKKLSGAVVDPMYAIISENTVYVIYNVPSAGALASVAAKRQPILEGRTALASGCPNVVSFNLITKEQEKLFPKMRAMALYGSHMIASKGEPALLVANIFDAGTPDDDEPTLKSLVIDMIKGEDDAMALRPFPLGVSLVRFATKGDIYQLPMGECETLGVHSVILKDSPQSGEIVIDITEDADEERTEKADGLGVAGEDDAGSEDASAKSEGEGEEA